MTIQSFTIPTDKALLESIKQKVAAYDWHEMPDIPKGGDRWIYGTDMLYMKELCAYWLNDYDWEQTLSTLNQFQHFTTTIDDQSIHFIHAKASKPKKALLLTHGWPGSVLEFMDVIEPLCAAGFDVVVPSLPGYGWSGKPKKPIGPRSTAVLWDRLMREALGYDSYVAQGGDWGSVVTGYLGLNHTLQNGGACEAIHLNMYGLRHPNAVAKTDEEKNWQAVTAMMMDLEGAYLRLQMTKPQTLSYGMMDSPVGACAWIVEKFHRWSDKRSGIIGDKPNDHIENAFSKDKLLSNVMIYLMTKTFNTATWFYRGALEEGMATMTPDEKVEVPTGIALFPGEFISFPPRAMMDVGYNIVHWQALEKGGHFAAMEQPEAFVKEVQAFLNKT